MSTFRRRVFIRLGILIVLIIIILLAQRGGSESHETMRISDILSSDVDITTIDINGIILSSTGDSWGVADSRGYVIQPARESRVTDFLQSYFSQELIRVASTTDFANLGIDANSPHIAFYDRQNRQIAESLLGNIASGASEQYFQLDAEGPVYAISTELSFYLSQEAAYWIDLRFWDTSVDVEDISWLTRRYADGYQDSWGRSDEGWTRNVDPFSVYAPLSDAFFRSILHTEANGLADMDLSGVAPVLSISFEDIMGDVRSISWYASGTEGWYYAIATGPDAIRTLDGRYRVYLMPEWRYEEMLSFG